MIRTSDIPSKESGRIYAWIAQWQLDTAGILTWFRLPDEALWNQGSNSMTPAPRARRAPRAHGGWFTWSGSFCWWGASCRRRLPFGFDDFDGTWWPDGDGPSDLQTVGSMNFWFCLIWEMCPGLNCACWSSRNFQNATCSWWHGRWMRLQQDPLWHVQSAQCRVQNWVARWLLCAVKIDCWCWKLTWWHHPTFVSGIVVSVVISMVIIYLSCLCLSSPSPSPPPPPASSSSSLHNISVYMFEESTGSAGAAPFIRWAGQTLVGCNTVQPWTDRWQNSSKWGKPKESQVLILIFLSIVWICLHLLQSFFLLLLRHAGPCTNPRPRRRAMFDPVRRLRRAVLWDAIQQSGDGRLWPGAGLRATREKEHQLKPAWIVWRLHWRVYIYFVLFLYISIIYYNWLYLIISTVYLIIIFPTLLFILSWVIGNRAFSWKAFAIVRVSIEPEDVAHLKAMTSGSVGRQSSGWWFGTFFIFPYIGNDHPNWLIFFRGVQTTNQKFISTVHICPWWGFKKRFGRTPIPNHESAVSNWFSASLWHRPCL